MAKIVKTNSQETALKEILDNLKIIASLNNVLDDGPLDDCKLKISGAVSGKTRSEQFSIPYTQIGLSLKEYRKKLISDVTQKSKTFSIVLDESDNKILNPNAEKAKQFMDTRFISEE